MTDKPMTMGDLVRLVTPNTHDHDQLPMFMEFEIPDSPDGYHHNEGFVETIQITWKNDEARILVRLKGDSEFILTQ